jgi:DHA2 family multidrug resistance protein-like MFS transporter
MSTAVQEDRAGRKEWIALAVLALPLLLVSMDVSILYFAVPKISEDLHASPTQQLWIFDIYGFVLAGLLVTMGAVADRIGARRLLLIGAVAFSATSLLAAYADSAAHLIIARAVLGVGGATLMPSTLAMIRTLFRDERQRGRAIGAWTAVMTAGIGLGPVLSGILLEHFWWGSVFLVNIPAMALLLATGPFLLPRGETRRGTRFDVPSAVLSLGAVLPTIYGIKEWAAHGIELRWIACIVVGLVLGAVFGRRQFTHDAPMINPNLLRNRRFSTAVITNAICTFALVGNAVFMTGYLQLVLGYGPLAAALWSIVPALGVGVAAPLANSMAQQKGHGVVVVSGFLVAAVGFGVLTFAGTDSLILVLIGAGVLAMGLVAAIAVGSELVLGAVRPEEAGAGSAVSEAGTEFGGALGIAILGSIGTAAYRSYAGAHLPAHVAAAASGSLPGALSTAASLPGPLRQQVIEVGHAAFVHGLNTAALVGAVMLVAAAVVLHLTRAGSTESGPIDAGIRVDHVG